MLRRMATESEDIGKALKTVIDKINCAAQRRPKTLPCIQPRLVAVTKTKPVSAIITAYQLGQRHFGENYVQELEEKSKNMKILEQCKDIRWHFIGHLQRNKSGKVAVVPNLYMVETVDSLKLAQTLNNHWEKYKRPGLLNVMVQINTSGEDNKSGCNQSEMCHLVKYIREKCPCLHFVGIMTIGAIGYDPVNGPNPDFLKLVECREVLCGELDLQPEDVELSMGMSSDYEHAIELGSTNVRVGSTIFGARDYGPKPPQTEAPPTAAVSQSNTEGGSTVSQSNTEGGASITSQPTSQQPGVESNNATSCDTNNHSTVNVLSNQQLTDAVTHLNMDDKT